MSKLTNYLGILIIILTLIGFGASLIYGIYCVACFENKSICLAWFAVCLFLLEFAITFYSNFYKARRNLNIKTFRTIFYIIASIAIILSITGFVFLYQYIDIVIALSFLIIISLLVIIYLFNQNKDYVAFLHRKPENPNAFKGDKFQGGSFKGGKFGDK